jgi:hypothetical protein
LADLKFARRKQAFGSEAAEGPARDSKSLADIAGINELLDQRRSGMIEALLTPISRDAFGPDKPEAFALHRSPPLIAVGSIDFVGNREIDGAPCSAGLIDSKTTCLNSDRLKRGNPPGSRETEITPSRASRRTSC